MTFKYLAPKKIHFQHRKKFKLFFHFPFLLKYHQIHSLQILSLNFFTSQFTLRESSASSIWGLMLLTFPNTSFPFSFSLFNLLRFLLLLSLSLHKNLELFLLFILRQYKKNDFSPLKKSTLHQKNSSLRNKL